MSGEEREHAIVCSRSPIVFIDSHVQTYDATVGEWVNLRLWPSQCGVMQDIHAKQLLVMLKARQLGCTTVVLAYVLWLLLFRPAATVLLFSRRDDEAVDLLDFRLKGMYGRLPAWCRCKSVVVSNDHEWELSNGSRVLAFGRVGGDSYTASMVVIDEADIIPDLDHLMRSVKPTIDAGGKMVMLSRPDKAMPESQFKKIYSAGKAGKSPWHAIFLPWTARPGRDEAWYKEQAAEMFVRTGSNDDLFEQYPATPDEALAPRSLDKRFPYAWLKSCYQQREPLTDECPAVPGLRVYALPVPERRYVIGADPAEGNPTSCDSAGVVLDAESGEEVAEFAGKHEMVPFAQYLAKLARWYNEAALMVERNNHGHAVLQWLVLNAGDLRLLGSGDGKVGWNTGPASKALMYDTTADTVRAGEVVIHSYETLMQLAGVEGNTLKPPDGQPADRAIAFGMAVMGRVRGGKSVFTREQLKAVGATDAKPLFW